MRKIFFLIFLIVTNLSAARILFDLTKAEDAGNADWMIDNDYPYPQPPNPTSGDDWIGGISDWGFDLHSMGHEVVTLPPWGRITYNDPTNDLDLSNFDVFVVCEPQVPFTQSEINAIVSFVSNGGGLFMVADHNASDRNNNGWDSPHIWNQFEQFFGIHFHVTGDPDNSINEDHTYNVFSALNDPITHGPAGVVHGMSFYGSTVMTLRTTINSSLRGHVWKSGTPQGTTDVYLATGVYGNGKIAGLTDSSPADDGTGNPGNVLYDGWDEDGVQNNFAILNTTLWLANVSGDVITLSYHPLSPTPTDTVRVQAEYNFSRSTDTLFYSFDSSFWMYASPESTFTASSVFKIPPAETETTVYFFVKAYKNDGTPVLSDTLFYQTRSSENYLILDGWQLIQENSHRVFTFNGVRLPLNSCLIIARGATKSQFENFWGVALPESVVYINGGGRFPVLNGRETFTLVNAQGDTIDGPTYTFQRGYDYQRTDFSSNGSNSSSWNILDWHEANPGTVLSQGGSFIGISEIADADTSGGYIYEFIEIFYGNRSVSISESPKSASFPGIKSNILRKTLVMWYPVKDVKIYNIYGREVLRFTGYGRTFDVSGLPDGVYLMMIDGKKPIKFIKY